MRLGTGEYVSAAICIAVLLWISRRYYVVLGRYKKYESPVKRLFFLSPLLIAIAGLAGLSVYAYFYW
jgi:hypothetical protein